MVALMVIMTVCIAVLWIAVGVLVSRMKNMEATIDSIDATNEKQCQCFDAITLILADTCKSIDRLEKRTEWMDVIDEQFSGGNEAEV